MPSTLTTFNALLKERYSTAFATVYTCPVCKETHVGLRAHVEAKGDPEHRDHFVAAEVMDS